MNRFVIMVDAGYLLRQSIELVSQRESSSRIDLEVVDSAGLVRVILEKAQATLALAGKELLRVYWYDGVMATGFTAQQRAIMEVDDVQFRAGTINVSGQQKGVDSLIVTDLIELTTHRAISDAILVTGDSDQAVGIELAQRRGVRVAVLGVEDLAVGLPHYQSFEITSRADRVGSLSGAELLPLLRYHPITRNGTLLPAHHSAGGQGESIATTGSAAGSWAGQIGAAEQERIEEAVRGFISLQATSLSASFDAASKRINPAVDGALLHHVFLTLGGIKLTDAQRVFTRRAFRAAIEP